MPCHARFITLTLGCPFLMIGARDHRHITVPPISEICHFRNYHVHGRVSIVRDVSRFTEGTPILDRDYEIIGQQRLHGSDIPALISFVPLALERQYFGRPRFSLALGNSEIPSPKRERRNDKKRKPDVHAAFSRVTYGPATGYEITVDVAYCFYLLGSFLPRLGWVELAGSRRG